MLVFALGLSMTVAPLTATVLADADERNAGIASGVNNAIARVAGLLGVALVGLIAGGRSRVAGFHQVMLVAAALVDRRPACSAWPASATRGRDVHCADCPGGALAGRPARRSRVRSGRPHGRSPVLGSAPCPSSC